MKHVLAVCLEVQAVSLGKATSTVSHQGSIRWSPLNENRGPAHSTALLRSQQSHQHNINGSSSPSIDNVQLAQEHDLHRGTVHSQYLHDTFHLHPRFSRTSCSGTVRSYLRTSYNFRKAKNNTTCRTSSTDLLQSAHSTQKHPKKDDRNNCQVIHTHTRKTTCDKPRSLETSSDLVRPSDPRAKSHPPMEELLGPDYFQ